MSDFEDAESKDWQPPTEAEMKVLQARRERQDKISKIMGAYLLKGYKMLDSVCTECNTILLQDKHKMNYCISCSELDSDGTKDDPALSTEAARRQAEEQAQRIQNPQTEDEPSISSTTVYRPPQHDIVSSHASGDNKPSSQIQGASSQMKDSTLESIAVVERKLSWATTELDRTSDVDRSIQLCQLIRECVETLKTLKSV